MHSCHRGKFVSLENTCNDTIVHETPYSCEILLERTAIPKHKSMQQLWQALMRTMVLNRKMMS